MCYSTAAAASKDGQRAINRAVVVLLIPPAGFMTLGIGMYAPSLIMISLLGMNPKAAFPIMMGSCAFLMPLASLRFLKAGSYATRPALGLALGGVPAVLLAAYLVKSLPLVWVRWLVIESSGTC